MVGKIKGKDDLDKGCDTVKTKDAIRKPLRIFCGQGSSAQFSVSNTTPANIGFVTVDAREMCKPLVKIKFSSIVNLVSTAFDPEAKLIFTLSRTCDNEQPIELNSWIYEAFQIESAFRVIGLINSFTFIYCDHLNCSRLCEYFVEVSVENIANAGVSVDNVQIQARAQ
ncbi:DUF4489 domain-containing protein [Wukongibacter baidiensis]|uniref:DUF4489 domain-containing protein n=1 Tax=Wukongibacter baidiensis TaxID=1723361 RepID=UPI003D7FFCB9